MTSSVPAGHKALENLMLIGSLTDDEKSNPGGKARFESHEAPRGNRFVILGEKMAESIAGKSGKGLYLTAQDSRTYPLVFVPGSTDGRFYISGDSPAPDGLYTLSLGPASKDLEDALTVDKSRQSPC